MREKIKELVENLDAKLQENDNLKQMNMNLVRAKEEKNNILNVIIVNII